MLLWIVLIVLVLALFGFGFTLHVLWYVAVVLLVLWVIGFFMRGRMGSGRSAAEEGPPRTGR
ncbi:hydrophobic protein [Streptomyces sp. NPDC020719]|uniref:hydrophobic protein n=1 Tax=Streptomyces sp. NPDC020719 TaxID=3154896 RepID=UPI003410C424